MKPLTFCHVSTPAADWLKEAAPELPVIFTRATNSVIGRVATVRASLDLTATVDYEGVPGMIIGARCFGVRCNQAMQKLFGYTIVNDITSRELQRRHSRRVIGKGIDSFCAMGPWLVIADEIENERTLQPETRVNGELRQCASVSATACNRCAASRSGIVCRSRSPGSARRKVRSVEEQHSSPR